jgi:pimeloyl-ACP methyl ester carboxylesterase
VVLLPGLDGTGLMFGPFVEALGRADFETRVVRYPVALTSYPACIHFARTLLPRDRPFLLLGESFSGPVALALAAAEPENLVGLVLCGTFARNPRPGLAWASPLLWILPARRPPLALLRFLLLGRWATEALMALVGTMLPQVPACTLKQRLLAVKAVDHTPLLARIQVPVLLLRGDRDRLVPPEATAWLRIHLPAPDLATLHGPHWLLQTRPDTAARAITAFLDRLPKPAPLPLEPLAAVVAEGKG